MDVLTGRWVVIAAERGGRPFDFKIEREGTRAGTCPLCPGHERETPPEITAYRAPGTAPDTPGWRVRVVPNKFPAVRGCGCAVASARGVHRAMPGIGAHEMVIESPKHVRGLEDLGPEEVAAVLLMWQERCLALRRLAWVEYIQVFKNVGRAAGASLEHTHSQIMALPFVPREVAAELAATGAPEGCRLCAVVRQELAEESRVVVAGRHVVVFAPFASRFPFELWVVPLVHEGDFARADRAVREEMALALHGALGRLARVLGRPPYNLILHTGPVNRAAADFHWHLEVLPRITVPAGFEFGTGYYVNPLPPEAAARYLVQNENPR
jgi:UDPglucose--hexose-1-phosphate uridylyltransferase